MVKIAVIGCGYWGKNLIRNFHELGVLAAVCDTNPEMAMALSKAYNAVSVKTIAEIAADTTITAVAIATPGETHAKIAEVMLKANKHLYIEKPMVLCVNEAERLVSLASLHQKVLMVGHLMQYHPGYIKLKEMVLAGELGQIQTIHASRLNLGKVCVEEDVTWSLASHDISMILGLTGSLPIAVTSTGCAHITPDIADSAHIDLEFAHKVKAHVSASWLHPYKEQKLVVIGSKQMAIFDDTQPWPTKLILHPYTINSETKIPTLELTATIAVPLVATEPLQDECRHFIDCIQQQISPLTNGEEGLRVTLVLSMAELSREHQRRIDLQTMKQIISDLPLQKSA